MREGLLLLWHFELLMAEAILQWLGTHFLALLFKKIKTFSCNDVDAEFLACVSSQEKYFM